MLKGDGVITKFAGIRGCADSVRLVSYVVVLACAVSVARGDETLLPREMEARQAVTTAASAIPPDQATTDIVRLAGEYSYGNGFDMNCTLEISAEGRFLFKLWNCETVVDQSSGRITITDGLIMLHPDKQRDSWPRGTASVMVPVVWGKRLYLVPQNDIAGFSNQVNRGLEPVSRGGINSYYLREGDWDRPVEGKPQLPDGWENQLLDEPVTGVIAGRDPSNRWIINLGKYHNIYEGMELSAWASDRRRFVNLLVTEIGEHTSAVEIVDAPPNMAIQGWTVYSKVTPPQATPVPVPTMPPLPPLPPHQYQAPPALVPLTPPAQ